MRQALEKKFKFSTVSLIWLITMELFQNEHGYFLGFLQSIKNMLPAEKQIYIS
jgi:hypothetical protein